MTLPYRTISEICYVTSSLKKSVLNWSGTVGAGPFFEVDTAVQNVIYRGKPSNATFKAALGFSGSTLMEFVQPTNDERSVWREMLREKDEALHHIYPNMRPLNAAEYDEQVAKYENAGLKMVWSSVAPPHSRNCLFDALDRIGCFIELLQIGEMDWGFMTAMHQAHLNWDRSRPYRKAEELFLIYKRRINMGFSEESTLKELMENEGSKAVLEKYIPGCSTNPMIKMGYTMSLELIASLPQAGISAETYKAILDDLSKL